MKKQYTVFMARLTYDKFLVEAESAKEAAVLVENGKISEIEMGLSADHDYFYDTPGTVVVVEPNTNDGCGYLKTIYRNDGEAV